MKKTIKVLTAAMLLASVFGTAEAQRRTGSNAAVVHRSVSAPSRAATDARENYAQRPAPVRTFPVNSSVSNNRPANSASTSGLASSANNSRPARPSDNNATSAPVRIFAPRSSGSSSTVSTGTSREVRVPSNSSLSQQQVARGSRSYNNTNRSYSNSNYRYNRNYNYYGSSYNRQPVFMYGPRYSSRPRNSVSIYFGSTPYYYTDGYYYGYYGGYYQPVFPPYGLRISALPCGYSRIYIGANPFYYYNGIYYREYNDNSYEVIDAPMGATVNKLPRGAKSVKVNGEKLYELNGTYYKADRNENGKDVYVVVGKNGEINNQLDDASLGSLTEGDIINTLPEGSKAVLINGQQFYQAPDGTFFSKLVDNEKVSYRMVGK